MSKRNVLAFAVACVLIARPGFAQGTIPPRQILSISPTDNGVPVGNGTIWQTKVLTDCVAATSAVTYNASTNAFGCNTLQGAITGTDTRVLFFDGANTPAGDAGLTYNKTTDSLDLAGHAALGGDASVSTRRTLSIEETVTDGASAFHNTFSYLTWNPATGGNGAFGHAITVEVPAANATDNLSLMGQFIVVTSEGSGDINDATGIDSSVLIYSSGAVTKSYAYYGYIEHGGSGTIADAYELWLAGFLVDTGNVTRHYNIYIEPPSITGAGSIGTNYGVWVGNQTVAGGTTDYAFWYNGGGANCDAGGVTRINHFGIFAYYNPCFAAYTPDAANHERLLVRWGDTGVFGTDNNAYAGVEVGGTGTNRQFNLLGASVHAMTVPGTYAAFRSLTTQPTSNYLAVDGTAGLTQTCAAAVTAVTIKNGLITAVTCP